MRARPRVLSSGQDAVGGPLPWRPTRMERTKPLSRAEHVGSPTHPPALSGARERGEKNEFWDAELKLTQHAATREVVRLKEGRGPKLAPDGEYNRHSWHRDFMLK